jgi:uncharacterized membrane protein
VNRTFGIIVLLYCAVATGAIIINLITGSKWKNSLLATAGVLGTILLKVILPLMYQGQWSRANGSSFRLIMVRYSPSDQSVFDLFK